MTRVGAIFCPYPQPPENLREAALAAEAAGVEELWLWEDCFLSSAFAAAAAALAWTERLRIGIGISPMPLRNVAVTAMEIATIERMFPGRLLPGVGHGVLPWMGQVGARVTSPLTLMREYVPALRGLLAHEKLDVAGRYVTLEGVSLDWPPAAPPLVYAAAEGPKTLVLSGEVADGTVLDSRHTVAEVATAIAAIRAGRAAAGRTGSPDIVMYLLTAFGADAEDRVRAELAGSSADGVPTDLLDRIAIGDPADVADIVRRYAAVGVDDVVLLPTRDADLPAFLEAAGDVGRRVSA